MPSDCPVSDAAVSNWFGGGDQVVIRGPGIEADSERAWFSWSGKGDPVLAWCPAVGVMTQARTKKLARKALQEAVDLWVESCIARGVLKQALEEIGNAEVTFV